MIGVLETSNDEFAKTQRGEVNGMKWFVPMIVLMFLYIAYRMFTSGGGGNRK